MKNKIKNSMLFYVVLMLCAIAVIGGMVVVGWSIVIYLVVTILRFIGLM